MLTIYGKWMYVYIMNNASSYGIQVCTKKSFRQKKKKKKSFRLSLLHLKPYLNSEPTLI